MLFEMAATEMRNIALGKGSRFCNMHDLTENLTDGNINSTEEITTKCGSNAFLDINLGSIYYIQYVLIYDGQGCNTFAVLNLLIQIILYCVLSSLSASKEIHIYNRLK